MIELKRGDKVKFLNETATGTVTRVIDREMVLVRTDDGFEYPVLSSELIKSGEEFNKPSSSVSDEDDTAALTREAAGSPGSGFEDQNKGGDDVQERSRRDEPDIFLAVVPFDHSEPVGGEVSLFIINDSEWSLLYHCATVDERNNRDTISAGMIEPGIKINGGDFHIDDLFGIDGGVELTVVAYGERTNESAGLFRSLLKPGKEYLSKRDAYKENDFFEEDAFIIRIEKRKIADDSRKIADDSRKIADDSRRMADDSRKMADDSRKTIDDSRKTIDDRRKTIDDSRKMADNNRRRPGDLKESSPGAGLKAKGKFQAGKREGKRLAREIDLHIGEIVDNSNELTPGEILTIQLARFRTSLEGAIISRERSVVYIHGTGEGKLKHEIRRIIDREYPVCSYQDASFREYGYGATLVLFKNRR